MFNAKKFGDTLLTAAVMKWKYSQQDTHVLP